MTAPIKHASRAHLAKASLGCIWLLALSATVLVPGPAHGQSSNNPARLDYSRFNVIAERNIFNSRRYGHSSTTRRDSRPNTRSESFTLVGTMSYEKGLFAFFDGTSSEYRKVAKPDDTIAGCKVVGIESSLVKLSSGTNQFELPIGRQMRKQEAEWQLAPTADLGPLTPAPAPYVRPPTSTVAQAEPAQPTNGEPSAIIVDSSTQSEISMPMPDGGGTNATPVEVAPGEDPVLARLRARAAAERGDSQ